MGKIELDHTGSGSGVTLSSDGTDLLLDGTAIGGGGGAALELYAENPSSPTAPSATGGNAVAIGSGASATNLHAISIGRNTTATGIYALSLNGNAVPTYSAAIGYNSAGGRATTATGQGSHAFGGSYASGTDSFAAAIANNTSSYGATGANSVAMGQSAKTSSTEAIALGPYTQATANAAVSIGAFSDATAQRGFALGNYAKAGSIGKFAFSNQRYAAVGDTQGGLYVLRQQTNNATPIALTTDSGGTPSSTQIILPSGSAYAFTGTIVAKQLSSSNAAAWEVKGLIVNQGGTTTLTNSATTVISNTPSWGMALSADDTNDALAITVTGAASTIIRWVANIQTSEVSIA